MKTILNTNAKKIKTLEVKYSNMTFIVWCYSHYMKSLNNPSWSKNRYTAIIKENGQGIGGVHDRKQLRAQMDLINSKPHLFIRN